MSSRRKIIQNILHTLPYWHVSTYRIRAVETHNLNVYVLRIIVHIIDHVCYIVGKTHWLFCVTDRDTRTCVFDAGYHSTLITLGSLIAAGTRARVRARARAMDARLSAHRCTRDNTKRKGYTHTMIILRCMITFRRLTVCVFHRINAHCITNEDWIIQ